jgi:hypothetical protein
LINRAIFGEEYRSVSSSLCSFVLFPVTSSFVGPNILFSALSQTPSAYVLLSVWTSKFTPVLNR